MQRTVVAAQESLWPLFFSIGLCGFLASIACDAALGDDRLKGPSGAVKRWSTATFLIEPETSNTRSDAGVDPEVDLAITTPSGDELIVPAYREPNGDGERRLVCRFTPRELGEYTARVRTHDKENNDADSATFLTIPNAEAEHGFLHMDASQPYVMRHDNGDPFRGIGANVAWEPRRRRNQRHTYDALFSRLSDCGVNTVRTWSCPWNLPIEWGAPRLGEYNEEGLARMDEMLALAQENGVYVILVLGYHGELQTESGYFSNNDRWKENPYNVANGGPCKTPADFFTDDRAKSLYKKRLRLLAARVAGHPHLLAWEFWNELDHFQRRGPVPGEAIVEWHAEMAEYLRGVDVYDHPITTSISVQAPRGLWEDEGLDFIMLHPYGETEKFVRLLSETSARYGKPAVAGEFSYSWKPPKRDEAALFERELRLGLWRGLMSPTPILPMTWWWEFHDQHDDWRHFRSVAAFSQRMTALGGAEWKPIEVETEADSIECHGVMVGETPFLWIHNQNQDTSENVTVVVRACGGEAFDVLECVDDTGEFRQASDVRVGSEGNDLKLDVPSLQGDHAIAFVLQRAARAEAR